MTSAGLATLSFIFRMSEKLDSHKRDMYMPENKCKRNNSPNVQSTKWWTGKDSLDHVKTWL